MEISEYRKMWSNFVIKITFLVFALFVAITISYLTLFDNSNSSRWTRSTLESELGIIFPNLPLLIDGRRGLPIVEVSFTAESSEVDAFVMQTCNGALHDGFDPFNAVELLEPQPESFLVEDQVSYYYVYSPYVRETTQGITCVQDFRVYNLLIEPTNDPTDSRVRLAIHFASGLAGYANQVNYKENWQPYESTE